MFRQARCSAELRTGDGFHLIGKVTFLPKIGFLTETRSSIPTAIVLDMNCQECSRYRSVRAE